MRRLAVRRARLKVFKLAIPCALIPCSVIKLQAPTHIQFTSNLHFLVVKFLLIENVLPDPSLFILVNLILPNYCFVKLRQKQSQFIFISW